MTTYYVGSGGNDALAGTSWANRFLTLTKAATAVAAGGDIVYVAPGTYRENVTFTVSGGNNYSTGTVTLTNGSTTVTGAGTTFTGGNVVAGYYFKSPNAGAIRVSAVNSATELILDSAWDGPSGAGLSYLTYNPIQWIGDYGGTNTDGVGGVVRWTGSADDIALTRANCIVASTVNYNHLTGFRFDLSSSYLLNLTSPTYWKIDKCYFDGNGTSASIYISGVSQLAVTISNCYIAFGGGNTVGDINYTHAATVNNTGHVIQNCMFGTHASNTVHAAVCSSRVGGILIRNSTLTGGQYAVQVYVALAAGQTITVNNCILCGYITALYGTALGEIVEDYNSFWSNQANRLTVNIGANSVAYPPLFDSRWWFEATK